MIYSKFLAHQGFRKYFANTFWLFGEKILRIAAALLVGIYVARYLGPEKFGLFSYALAFVALFSTLAKLGLDDLIIRDLVNAPHRRDLYLGTAFVLKIIGAVLAGVGIFLAILLIENNFETKLYIGIIALGLIFQSFEVVDFYFQSRVMSKYVSICKIFQLTISSLMKVYFVAINADLFYFVLVSLIDQVTLAGALGYAYSKQKVGNYYMCFDKNVAKELLFSSKPLIISGVIVAIYTNIDRLVIKEMLGIKELGLYVAGTGLANGLYFVPMLIANSFFPAILNAKQKSSVLYNRRLSLLYKYTLFGGLLVCILVTFFSEKIIILFYGVTYIDSASALQIYIWNFLIICFSAIFGKWLLSENLQYLLPRFTFLAAIINVAGCLIFIPLFSINGAAIAALSAQLVPFIWFGITNKEIKSQIKCAIRIQ